MDLSKGMRADGLGHPFFFFIRRRYYVAIMACLGYIVSYSTRVNLSVAILFMTEFRNQTDTDGTTVSKKEFDWDEETQAMLLASFFYGYIVTQIPGGYLSGEIGGNHVLNIGVAGSGIVSFFGPLCVKLSIISAVAMRVICGLFQGITVPAVSSLWARWAPPLERTLISTIAISGNFFSSFIIMPICCAIGNNLGWEWMFYIFGIASLIWSLIWGLTVFAGPEIDRFIKQSELAYIQAAIGERTDQKPVHPWRKIFSSMPVGACVVSQTGHNWGYYTLLLLGPLYYNRTLDCSVRTATLFTGVSFTITGIVMTVFGQIQDMMRRRGVMSTVRLRKLFCCGGFAIQTMFMVLLAIVKDKNSCIAFSILAIGLGGITWSAFNVNPLDIAAPHASIIAGIMNTSATLSGIFSPFVCSFFVKDKAKNHHTMEEWRWVWVVCAVVYAFSGLFFFIFAAGEKQSWVYSIASPEAGEGDAQPGEGDAVPLAGEKQGEEAGAQPAAAPGAVPPAAPGAVPPAAPGAVPPAAPGAVPPAAPGAVPPAAPGPVPPAAPGTVPPAAPGPVPPAAPGTQPGAGRGAGLGPAPAAGPGAGRGAAPAAGPGAGRGAAPGAGPGAGRGAAPGAGRGAAPGAAPGAGRGAAPGAGRGAAPGGGEENQ